MAAMPSSDFSASLPEHFAPVALDKCYRLLNHGPTVLVSAQHDGQANVMAAAWACALDFHPPKVTVVIDKAAFTRGLIEQSGRFALQLPTVPQAALTVALGSTSAHQMPDKLQPMTCSLAKWRAPGLMCACLPTGTGSVSTPRMHCAPCTMWLAAISTRLGLW